MSGEIKYSDIEEKVRSPNNESGSILGFLATRDRCTLTEEPVENYNEYMIRSRRYVDYVQVQAKEFNLGLIKGSMYQVVTLYSNWIQKRLPAKYFSSFHRKGSTYFMGKVYQMDMHILMTPSPDYDCVCCNNSFEPVHANVGRFLLQNLLFKIIQKLPYYVRHGSNLDVFNYQIHRTWDINLWEFQTIVFHAN